MSNQYIFLSGMPRTGSNLLSSILNQNNLLHSEGISAMCNILWRFNLSILEENTQIELSAVNKNNNEKIKKMATSLFDSYYDKENKIIFDKCFSWTIPENIDLLKKYITDKPKIIILTRNIEDIVKSYVNVFLQNGYSQFEAEEYILDLNNLGLDMLLRPISGLMSCKVNKDLADFIYIDYDDLILNTKENIKKIYDFCNIPYFNHEYKNLELKYPENSEIVFKNLIEVRPEIKKRNIDVVLSEASLRKIKKIENLFKKIEKDPKNKKTIEEFKKFYASNMPNSFSDKGGLLF